VCCGGVLVLVSPGLDPAYSPAMAAQEALSRTPDVTCDTIDQTISVPWWARTSCLVTCLVAASTRPDPCRRCALWLSA
jgi:hypothetical protein